MHRNSTGGSDADRSAVLALLERISNAWSAGDASTFASYFLTDAPYITFMGTVYRGAAEIHRSHAPLFTAFLRGTKLYAEVVDVTFPSPGVAIVVTQGDVAKKRPRTAPKVQAYTLVETDAGWRVALFQNTSRKPIYEMIGFALTPEMRPAGTANRR